MHLLLADIGGTNTRCAIGTVAGAVGHERQFRNSEFDGPAPLLAHYVAQLPAHARPRRGALAVAAPIQGDEVRMLNISWHFSGQRLAAALGLEHLHLLNDFMALARALPELAPADCTQVGGGAPRQGFPRGVLGPGTGLGVASLVEIGSGWLAIPGEGGHVTLAAQDATEERVVRSARERFGHCSAERILSGAGLGYLHATLHGEVSPDAAQIGERALTGDAQALETLEVFFRLLGTVAGNLALTLGAFGGIYVGGGIVPRYLGLFERSGFRERFEGKGRYREYLAPIPTWVITAERPALRGLLAYLRERL